MAQRPSYKELQRMLDGLQNEVLERKRVEADLENELGKFRGLYGLAVAMTSDRSLDEYLRLIVDKCREILRSEVSYIALHDDVRDDFYKHTSSGIQTEAFKNLRLPSGRGLGGLVARTRQGYIVNDYLAESSFDRRDDQIIANEGIISGMAVPIQMATETLGVLYIFNRTKTVYSQSDLDTLFLIANLAAVEIKRKQSENLLRESEERFRFMVETTGDVIYRLHYDSMTYDYLSPGISKLTGYSPEEIKALGFSRLVTRIDMPEKENVSPKVILEDRLAGKTGEYRADYLIATKTGASKWLRDHSFPWFDGRRIVGSVGILSDVTDYKRAEALVRQRTIELTESEEKYRTLVENVPLVVYRIGPTGEVLFTNQFVEELIGRSPAEILRDPGVWSGAIYDEDRKKVRELRKKALLEGREFLIEYRVVHKNNYLVHVVDHAIPFKSPEGQVSSVDGIIMDVTGRVKLQEKLIQSEGIKTISEVSARLAHEIRNPLVSAGGFARRLLSSIGSNDPNREKVEIIIKEVGRLEGILRMILNYIQPIDLELSPTDPNHLVEIALRGIEADVTKREVSIQTQLSPGLPAIPVDQLQMKQVLKSLLKTALRQIPSGAKLSISTSLKNDMYQFVMRYPAHLSQDDLEHFFYPFTTFTVDYPVDLPMSKIIVHKHGGTIDVRLEKPGEVSILMSLPAPPQQASLSQP
ncbi:MAG: PAS domain S-box protein [Syntrophobacteraceae bacterium]